MPAKKARRAARPTKTASPERTRESPRPAASRPEPAFTVPPALRQIAAILAIVATAVAAYAGSLRNGFTYDDPMVIQDAAPFLAHGPYRALFSPFYFALSREGTYRPVVTASYIADFRAWQFWLPGYHAQNVFWHVLTALGVAALAARLLPDARRRAAVVAGLLFACHPLTSEAVENISFREDLLATCFVVMSMLLALRGTVRALVLGAITYALALLSKESAVVMPFLLMGCRLAFPTAPAGGTKPATRATLVREALALGAVTAVYLAIRFGPMAGPPHYAAFAGGTRAATLWTMPRVLARYLRLVFAPWPLVADYSGYFGFGLPSGDRLWALLTLPLCAGALWLAWRRDRLAATGLGWFLLALAPVSSVIATPIFAAERFLYLPLVGPALAASALAARLDVRTTGHARRLALATGLAVLGTFVALTNARHAAWRNNLALWLDVAEHNPRSYRAHANIAVQFERSSPAFAEAQLEQSLALCPYVPGAEDVDNILCSSNANKLGEVRLRLGDLDGAQAAFQLSLRIRPSNPQPVRGLEAVALARRSREFEEF
ncbi:MAG: hypothetical protein WCJ30_05400 [Deltaproteobacteria bacterium]